MKIQNLRNGLIAAILGLLALSAASGLANAQDNSREYRDWQRAQTQAQQRYNDYLRTRRSNDYRRWQQAQAEAQRRQSMYQQRAYNNRSYYPNNNVYVTPGVRYRVYRNGQTFYVDSRGASMLRTAINTGYQQGYQQGILDRRYGRGFNYYGNQVYSEGSFGYQSYVDRDQYQYYFQQGFQRGYEDGFNNTFRYGTRNGNSFSILGSVIGSILDLATDR
ncbi:MAG TPA: hypothetical protein VGJ02_09725 [Pyrinomonadaceae bacterium]